MTNKVSDVHTYYPHVYLYPTLLFASVINAGLRLLILWTVRLCLIIRENQISTWYIQLLTMIDGDHIISSILLFTYYGGVRYPETRGRHFKGRNRRDTGQEEGAHICFTAIFQAMERRPQIELPPQFNFVLVWAPWNSRAWLSCKTYVCAHFLFCIPSAPSLKIPACCLVRVFRYPLNLDKISSISIYCYLISVF